MKKLTLWFFIGLFCIPSAFADGGSISRALPASKTADSQNVSPRGGADKSTTPARTAASRESESDTDAAQSTTVRSASRVINVNNTNSSPRNISNASRTSNISRGAGITPVNSQRSNLDAAVNTVGRNARVNAASINNNPAVRRAGVTLRPSTAEVGGRAKIAGTDIQTGSNIGNEVRAVQSRAGTTTSASTQSTAETIAAAKDRLEQTADLNKSCQEQYNDCMDQFCAVIDANQKRCSCSSNLSRYTKVENAVKDANTQLNEVAQRIRYVGLSADEIRAIMNATEAEDALTGATDTSETRNMLEEIENLIKDPTSSTSYSADTYSGLDMDLDFSSDAADIFSLDFLSTNNSSSFSNLRGSELYTAAKKRCNTVLNQCKDAGATTQQITGNYDLAIDKDCIAYEQGLTKMNETLVSNVRSANRMLQKARLAVLQNKNQYDAKGCIAALDTCMTDDMVCGADYTKCLDPTKRYIDENGDVVLGQNITNITAFMEKYNNARIGKEFLQASYGMTISDANCKLVADETETDSVGNNGACVAKYLLQKIGTKAKVTDEGLCRAVLDKCQRYTYNSEGVYQPYNDVVANYVQRAMVNIKSAQQDIISDYASSCMVDVATCYNQQVTQVNAWSSNASVGSIQSVMRGACRNVALTCAYAVFAKEAELCKDENTCINNISEMFYQSLLCPDNSVYEADSCNGEKAENGKEGCVNDRCKCNAGYVVWGNSCLVKCSDPNMVYNQSGICVCESGFTLKDGKCVTTGS